MSETAGTWLNNLTSLYTPTSTQFDAAKSHRSSIEARLNDTIGIYRMSEIGSLRHGTGIWTFSDADYLVSLKGDRPSSPWTTLIKVKEGLQQRFPGTHIAIRQPAVVCEFSDGVVEVVPGYISSSGYWIPNPAGGWMKSHPEEHNEYVNSVNKKHNGGAKTLARQLKIWKYLRSVPVSSCYLEMRAAQHLADEPAYLAFWDLHVALKKMHNASLAAMNDPTGLGSRFGACSSEAKRAEALSKLGTAVVRARKAREFESAGEHAQAIEQLKLLFNR
ncbi:nucleotidyltransferase [Corynebacterium sp. J010B-136]|uniref:SMODS domain-containing nucleotidyltransferase n=1 Tax=Corynebacterium sp. J010B-136 TaxID=2099401 RepID=UPI000CFA39AB|nr:nucleotidyltransferase [Corynebacterium sp. J010B-136]PQM73648.1 nucleotidyltransferase [Corynebacterium sp. J010B-136]